MTTALIDNVSRFPSSTLCSFEAAPVLLRDESKDTLISVAKIWAREGLRERVLVLADKPGVSLAVKLTLLRACATGRREMTNVH